MNSVTIIVETPKGSPQKYDYDPETGMMKLKKVMPLGLVFPFDFGFIPGTIGGDKDPLDVLLISEVSTFAGCLVDCRIIGGLKVVQKERDGKLMRNDRLIAIPEFSSRYAKVNTLRDLPEDNLKQIIAFFTTYNEQAGKKFKVLEKLNPVKAMRIIDKSRQELPMRMLVELFLPLYDKKGNLFPEKYYKNLRKELTAQFGGITEYAKSPATGFWKPNKNMEKDELLVFEIMCVKVNEEFWDKLKLRLMKTFKQESILIRSSQIEIL